VNDKRLEIEGSDQRRDLSFTVPITPTHQLRTRLHTPEAIMVILMEARGASQLRLLPLRAHHFGKRTRRLSEVERLTNPAQPDLLRVDTS